MHCNIDQIPRSSDNKEWYSYIDNSVTPELLDGKLIFLLVFSLIFNVISLIVLAHEFVEIYESCPSRFRAKVDSKQQVCVYDMCNCLE